MNRRLGDIDLAIRAGLRLLVRGSARGVPEKLNTVLIVPAGQLGDIVCTTPVLRALREYSPNARILLADERVTTRELLADGGLVDDYITQTQARTVRPDAVLLTGPSGPALFSALISGSSCIVAPRVLGGSCPQETRLYKFFLNFVHTVDYHFGAYAPRERLFVLGPLGIHVQDTNKHLAYSVAGKRDADNFLREKGIGEGDRFVCIAPSAGNKIKEWPRDRFEAVARHIVEDLKISTLFVEEKDGLSLDVLKALIARAALFVGVDTGPIYIAEAFGIPTVDITGPIDEQEQPPIGPKHIVVTPPGSREPELFVWNARGYNFAEARRQVESITVQDVNHAVDKIVPQLKAS